MSRIIRTQGSPTTQRNRMRRAVAEALRRLMEKPAWDAESKDLTALIVFSLREIRANVQQSAEAWEKRDYYMKAERFLRDWEWTGPMERLLMHALLDQQHEEVRSLLAQLLPHFQDITVNKFTVGSALWEGAYERLAREQAGVRGKL